MNFYLLGILCNYKPPQQKIFIQAKKLDQVHRFLTMIIIMHLANQNKNKYTQVFFLTKYINTQIFTENKNYSRYRRVSSLSLSSWHKIGIIEIENRDDRERDACLIILLVAEKHEQPSQLIIITRKKYYVIQETVERSK